MVSRTIKDITGQRFGRLIAIRPWDGSGRRLKWVCACDCGGESYPTGSALRAGKILSCGCLRNERLLAALVKHGEALGRKRPSPEYSTWISMRNRCNNPKNHAYSYYGGRGISVCERWNDYANFIADMGPRPSPTHSIDRENNDGNYEPSNCRWATKTEQAANQRAGGRFTKEKNRNGGLSRTW